ncbi:MAG TPA: DUF2156 domain-containing protein, partial [Aliiroseovarius sp.]|nr:DUF2156 domain-containing protein [Aliiroseovarius sp.]
QNGRLVGFLSLMQSRSALVLDLMRYERTAPDGTMHLALTHAITEARVQGLRHLSLAALPIERDTFPGRHLARIGGAAGLSQFKHAFAPHWRPLYLAAPSRVALAIAALEISREIRRKPRRNRALPQVKHASNAFAPEADPWQHPPM